MARKESGRIKSAYELALERLGGIQASPLTAEQKERLGEIERVCESKIAEKKIVLEERIREAALGGDAEAVQKLQEEMIGEVAALRQEMEREKEKARKGKAARQRRRA